MPVDYTSLLKKRPTWELRNMVKALSLHSWLNTKDEDERLRVAKLELKRRKKYAIITERSAIHS